MGRLAKIKVGATVGQDFSFFRWPKEYEDFIFEVEDAGLVDKSRKILRKHGFGITGKGGEAYGNGAVYVNEKNLIYEDGLGCDTPTKKVNRNIKM